MELRKKIMVVATLLSFLGSVTSYAITYEEPVYLIKSAKQDYVVLGKVKRGYLLIAELSVKKSLDSDSNLYRLRYLDATTGVQKSLTFVSTDSDISKLRLLLLDHITKKNGETSDLKIGSSSFVITTQKIMGLRNILFTVNEYSSFGLNGSEIKNLFGK